MNGREHQGERVVGDVGTMSVAGIGDYYPSSLCRLNVDVLVARARNDD